MPKGRYRRTDQRAFIHQLTQIERRQARLRRIKQRRQKATPQAAHDDSTSDPHLHHHIGQSEKIYDEIGHYLRSHAGDPAMKVFVLLLNHYRFDTCSGLPSSVERSRLGTPRSGAFYE